MLITLERRVPLLDYFGAEQLPVLLGAHGELPRVFTREIWGRAVPSRAVIAVLALLAVNLVDLHALSAATSGGFLVVYAIVNLANVKLARETESRRWISMLAAVLCIAALASQGRIQQRAPLTSIGRISALAAGWVASLPRGSSGPGGSSAYRVGQRRFR